jgi:hypothetical protein
VIGTFAYPSSSSFSDSSIDSSSDDDAPFLQAQRDNLFADDEFDLCASSSEADEEDVFCAAARGDSVGNNEYHQRHRVVGVMFLYVIDAFCLHRCVVFQFVHVCALVLCIGAPTRSRRQ